MQKKIPIGIDDYKNLIDNNCYYVDKTLLIKELFEEGGAVTLLPRPRRFGKTINLSMIAYFFERSVTSHKYLFEDKAIWSHDKYRSMQGLFPVISLSLKGAKARNFNDTYEALTIAIANEVQRHKPELHSVADERDSRRIDALINQTASQMEYATSIAFISQLLAKAYKQKTIVLLDEYDTPIHSAYHNGFYNDIIDFMRNLMGEVFKGNKYLERGVITGIMRTAKEGIFSGLNNLLVSDMFDTNFSDKFGFTQHEVGELLENQGLSDYQEEVKNWYNGYRFGARSDMYNPWSVLECVKHKGRIEKYWVNTSENSVVKTLLAKASAPTKKALELMLNKKESELKEILQNVVFPDVDSFREEATLSFLLFSGYLTLGSICELKDGSWCASLRIPNQEIYILYRNLLKESMSGVLSQDVQVLLEALIQGKAKVVKNILKDLIINSMSFYDIPKKEVERSYHLFILGLLTHLEGRYLVQSNRESGFGRYDIMLIPQNPSIDAGIIIEFKSFAYSECKTIEDAAQNALDQINKQQYAAQLKAHHCSRIYQYGIAFEGKEMELVMEKAL